jgi:hypothetical protein
MIFILQFLSLPVVLADEREQRKMASTLDRQRELALVASAGTSDAARDDFPAFCEVPPQRLFILVVDMLDFVFAKPAGLASTPFHRHFSCHYLHPPFDVGLA